MRKTPDLGVGSLSGPLQVLAGTSAVADSTTLLTAFGTNAKVLATSSGGQLELDPAGTFGGVSVGSLLTATAGLTVSAGTITFDTVPQTSLGGSINNVGYGANALANAASGSLSNSAFGQGALKAMTTAINNTAIGQGALLVNTTGGNNTAVGTGALGAFNDNTSADDYHVAIGFNAGSAYTGNERNNTVIGSQVIGTIGESNTLRIGNPNTTLLLGLMTGVTTADYLSIAGMIATANGGVAPTAVVVPASGTAYTPSTTVNTELFISGGTVTVVAINGVNVGLLSGHVYMKKNDTITFTYTVAPTVYQMTA